MNDHRRDWTLGQRLLVINGVMFVLLAAVAVAICHLNQRRLSRLARLTAPARG